MYLLDLAALTTAELLSRPLANPNGRRMKTEALPQLIHQETLGRKVKWFAARGKHYESRRL